MAKAVLHSGTKQCQLAQEHSLKMKNKMSKAAQHSLDLHNSAGSNCTALSKTLMCTCIFWALLAFSSPSKTPVNCRKTFRPQQATASFRSPTST
eukprot:763857-Hanusia_phi.AAC.5